MEQKEQTKICSTCRRDLPLSMYHKNKNTYDGYQYSCRMCLAEQRLKYSEKKTIVLEMPLHSRCNSKLVEFSSKELIKELVSRGYFIKNARFKIKDNETETDT